jgi:hypothetical protein
VPEDSIGLTRPRAIRGATSGRGPFAGLQADDREAPTLARVR